MAESNAALATQVYRLREQLGSLQAVVNGLTADEGGHEHPHLAKELEGLAQILRGHIEAEEERVVTQAAPVWVGLSDGEYRDQLSKVGVFVDEHLRVAYKDYWRDLQDCWPHHPEALWELGNLWAEWNRTYDRDQPSLTGALNWHDRWMPGARARLRDIMTSCRGRACTRSRP